MSLSMAGGSIGLFALPPLLQYLLDTYALRVTLITFFTFDMYMYMYMYYYTSSRKGGNRNDNIETRLALNYEIPLCKQIVS